ncbi:hypothetical protein FB451DRAFT_1192554 [Mycena latifolia]|nr:hypothetical protein FB451DRAFT_1192554 [Mycena latifolia]
MAGWQWTRKHGIYLNRWFNVTRLKYTHVILPVVREDSVHAPHEKTPLNEGSAAEFAGVPIALLLSLLLPAALALEPRAGSAEREGKGEEEGRGREVHRPGRVGRQSEHNGREILDEKFRGAAGDAARIIMPLPKCDLRSKDLLQSFRCLTLFSAIRFASGMNTVLWELTVALLAGVDIAAVVLERRPSAQRHARSRFCAAAFSFYTLAYLVLNASELRVPESPSSSNIPRNRHTRFPRLLENWLVVSAARAKSTNANVPPPKNSPGPTRASYSTNIRKTRSRESLGKELQSQVRLSIR